MTVPCRRHIIARPEPPMRGKASGTALDQSPIGKTSEQGILCGAAACNLAGDLSVDAGATCPRCTRRRTDDEDAAIRYER